MNDPFRTDDAEPAPRRQRLFYCPKCGSTDNQILLRPTEEEFCRRDHHSLVPRTDLHGRSLVFEWFDVVCNRCGWQFSESMGGHDMGYGGIHTNIATVREKERIEGTSAPDARSGRKEGP